MKSNYLAEILIFTAAFFVSGCDLLEKAADVTFNAEIEVNWIADENAEGANAPYSHSETVDLNDNAEVAKYSSKIKEIKINKITYYISGYDASPHNSQVYFTNGVASFAATGASTPTLSVPYAATATGVNLQTATSETELDIDAAGLNELATLFKANKKLVMTSAGNLSITPVAFTVVSKFYITVTANALD